MKEEKNKVGRPKLADDKTKKQALIFTCVALVILIILLVCCVNVLFGKLISNSEIGSFKGEVATTTEATTETTTKNTATCEASVKSIVSNKLNIETKCGEDAKVYKTSITNSKKTYIGKIMYSAKYGESTKKVVYNISTDVYKITVYFKTKTGEQIVKQFTVKVKGSEFSQVFGLNNSQICLIGEQKISGNNMTANITCGKNAVPYEVYLVNRDKSTSEKAISYDYFKGNGNSGFGYSGSVYAKIDSDTDKYALRLYYKAKNADSDVSLYIKTTPSISKTTTTAATTTVATTKNTTKKGLNGNCIFKDVSAYVSGGKHIVKYSTKCSGNAKVTNIAYKTPYTNDFVNRKSAWGAVKGETSTISFASANVGKKVTLKLYYDTSTSSKSKTHSATTTVTVK